MSFETVERLKRDFTDKWVTVDAGTPELKRFVGLSGRIKTINMNGRALVQFDGPVDISWYDIDLSYLKVIEAPLPKKVAEKHAEPAAKKPTAVPAAAAAPAAPGAAKKSPIEIMREAAAAKAAAAAGGTAAPAPAAPAAKKSPIEIIREAAAAKAAAAAGGTAAAPAPAAAPVAAAEPAPAPAPAAAPAAPVSLVGEDGKPLSKLELARRQGAAKNK